MSNTLTVHHFPKCSADYPEKPKGEAPQQLVVDQFDGYTVVSCVDCGAFATDLPDENHPYWDEVRDSIR